MENEKIKTLIIKQLLSEATKAEVQELDKWRRASPENEKLYSDYAKIWFSSPKAEPETIPEIDNEWRQVAEALDLKSKKTAKIVELKRPVPSVRIPIFHRPRYWAVAAAFVLIFLGSLFFNRLINSDRAIEIFVRAGAQEQVELPDGSSIRLNSVSSVSYEAGFPGKERIVNLTGEAFFEIENDGRPFVVNTENARIRVLGTSFNVWARQNETRVIVEEGRVVLQTAQAAEKQQVLLTMNQMAVCSGNEIFGQPIAVDAAQRLGWLSGKIVFSKTPLSEVVAELQRLYDVSIRLDGGNLAGQTLTASFSKKSIESVLESVCLAMHLKFDRVGEIFTISEL